MVRKKTDSLVVTTELSPEFSVIHIDGTFGGVSADKSTAWIQFFQDIPDSQMLSDDGGMAVTQIRRKMLMDLRMSMNAFKAIAKWMDDTVKQIESTKK